MTDGERYGGRESFGEVQDSFAPWNEGARTEQNSFLGYMRKT